MHKIARLFTVLFILSAFFTFAANAQSEISWGEPVNGFIAGIETDPASPLKLTAHIKYTAKEKAVFQITNDSLDWQVIFISDSKDQPVSYKAEDTSWWDSFPHYMETDFVAIPEHMVALDFAKKKWIFHAYDPAKNEVLTDLEQKNALPAGSYKVQFEFKAIEAMTPASPGESIKTPKSGLQTITVPADK